MFCGCHKLCVFVIGRSEVKKGKREGWNYKGIVRTVRICVCGSPCLSLLFLQVMEHQIWLSTAVVMTADLKGEVLPLVFY